MTTLETNLLRPSYDPTWPKAMSPSCRRKISQIAWNLFSLIVFPVGIVRLINHYVIRPLAIKFLILPALLRGTKESNNSKATLLLKDGSMGNIIKFATPNGEKITGIYIKGKKHPEKLVIGCGGQGQIARKTSNRLNEVTEGFSRLIINPMGVDGSSGHLAQNGLNLEESLALPVYSAFEYAVKHLNYQPENIVLYGYSLGGLSVTLAATHIQEVYGHQAIKIVNDRSLRSLTQFVTVRIKSFFKELREKKVSFSEIRQADGLEDKLLVPVNIFLKCLAHITPDTFINIGVFAMMKLVGLEADAEKAWLDKLEFADKCIIYAKNDQVIPFEEGAALFKGVCHKSLFENISLPCDSTNLGESTQNYEHHTPLSGNEARIVHDQISAFFDVTPALA